MHLSVSQLTISDKMGNTVCKCLRETNQGSRKLNSAKQKFKSRTLDERTSVRNRRSNHQNRMSKNGRLTRSSVIEPTLESIVEGPLPETVQDKLQDKIVAMRMSEREVKLQEILGKKNTGTDGLSGRGPAGISTSLHRPVLPHKKLHGTLETGTIRSPTRSHSSLHRTGSPSRKSASLDNLAERNKKESPKKDIPQYTIPNK